MLCQSCKNKEAAFHYVSNVNGQVTEAHLCHECAGKLGYDLGFKAVNYFDSALSNFVGGHQQKASEPVQHCPLCGASQNDIAKTGKVGCAQCYATFSSMLMPFIKRIHGNTEHVGKIPASAGAGLKLKRELEDLKQELKAAVDLQEYENAARLRDRIIELEKEAG